MSFTHETVLLNEAVDALMVKGSGIYIDGTFGRGGHSQLVLKKLDKQGRLIAVDKDPMAIAQAQTLQDLDPRFSVRQGSFSQIKTWIAELDLLGKVDGILLDLGLSSPQLDDAERGFSFMHDGPLDMRMDNAVGLSAKQWLAEESQEKIAQVIKEYGEERFAKRIAGALVKARAENEITTTQQLADIVSAAIPKWEKHKHPATRTFQAIRIFINRELADLEDFLADVLDVLAVEGRLAVISFHSLEDRIVKQYMKKQAKGDDFPEGLPITADQLNQRMRIIGKPVRASAEEVDRNPRARSAIMRVAEKLN